MRTPLFVCDSRVPLSPCTCDSRTSGLPAVRPLRKTLPHYADLTIVTVVPNSSDILNSTESITSRMI